MRHWFSLLYVAFIVLILAAAPVGSLASEEQASAMVAEASSALRGAFRAAVDAEKSGANVSVLMEGLTEAGSALTDAEMALGTGDYSLAIAKADACKTLADATVGDATTLKEEALAQASGYWVTILSSAVGAGAFVGVLYLVWRWFKKYYALRLLKGRPEAAT